MMIIKLPHFHMMITISSQDHLDGGARPPPGQAQLLLPRQAKALPCCSTSITACHHSICMLCRPRCGPGSICALRSTQNSWLAHTDSACIAKHRPNDPLCKQFVAVVPKHTPKNKMYSKSRKIHSTSSIWSTRQFWFPLQKWGKSPVPKCEFIHNTKRRQIFYENSETLSVDSAKEEVNETFVFHWNYLRSSPTVWFRYVGSVSLFPGERENQTHLIWRAGGKI